MSGQKERPAVSAAGLGNPLGTEYKDSTTTTPARAVEAKRAALIGELWPQYRCSFNELADWAQAYVDQAIAKEVADMTNPMIPAEAVEAESERDELALLLADAIYRYTGVSTSSSKEMADEILDAGWSK